MKTKKLFIIVTIISAVTTSMNANAWWGGLMDEEDKYNNSYDQSHNHSYYESGYNKIFSYRYVTDTQLTPQQARIEFARKLHEDKMMQFWVDIK